jgi:hypothetical protein
MPARKVQSKWVTGNLQFMESPIGSDGQVIFGHTNGGLDVLIRGTTSSYYSLWDESANAWIYEGVDIKLNDSDYLIMGDSSDALLCWDGSKIALTAAAASSFQVGSSGANINTKLVGTVIVGTTGKGTGKDVTIYGTTTINAIRFDASANRLELDGIALTGSSVASEYLRVQAWGTAAANVISLRNSTGDSAVKLGFFAAAPVAQQAHIDDASGTSTSLVAQLNKVYTALENYGLLLTA